MSTVEEWIATDRASVAADVRRLGLEAAAQYQLDLMAERLADGDNRWAGVSLDEMIEALQRWSRR